MKRNDRLVACAPREIGMNHLAYDRAGPDQSHFHYEVIEIRRLQPRERRHLSATLHLEHADRVTSLQSLVDQWIILRKLAQIDFLTPMIPDQSEAIFEHRHHAEAKQVDLDNSHVGAVF